MPSPERFYQPQPLEAPQTDHGERAEEPTTSLRMEQAVTHLATVYGVDLAQPGAALDVELPEQSHRWLIANIDGQRIGVTRCQVDAEQCLSPEVDMIFAITPNGWEPQELIHGEQVWHEYANAMQRAGQSVDDQQADFNFTSFTDYMAQGLE